MSNYVLILSIFFFIMRIRNSHCKVLQECSSWTSRNGLVQMFFPTPNRNMFTEKRVKLERLLAILREHVTYNVKWVEVHKVHEAFWAKLYCKTRDFFTNFCWLWDFLLENLKFKKKLWWCPLEYVDVNKKSCMPEIIFSWSFNP